MCTYDQLLHPPKIRGKFSSKIFFTELPTTAVCMQIAYGLPVFTCALIRIKSTSILPPPFNQKLVYHSKPSPDQANPTMEVGQTKSGWKDRIHSNQILPNSNLKPFSSTTTTTIVITADLKTQLAHYTIVSTALHSAPTQMKHLLGCLKHASGLCQERARRNTKCRGQYCITGKQCNLPGRGTAATTSTLAVACWQCHSATRHEGVPRPVMIAPTSP